MKRLIHSNIRKSIKYLILIGVILSIAFLEVNQDEIDHDKLKSVQLEINNYCNRAVDDMQENEKEHLKHMESESDPFKRAVSSSTLALINTVKGDYESVLKYGDIAAENYLKVENGEYYAISEYKYIAWSMLRGGRFSESFKIASKLMEILEDGGQELLSMDEITEIGAMIHSIFVNIYSELKLPEKAEIYYKKLNDIDMTEDLLVSIGDKILYSKIVYANSIKDYELMKKHAEECYELVERTDEIKGIDTKKSILGDIAYANIKLGHYDEGVEQLKIAEEYLNRVGDINPLASIYNGYAIYYSGLGDNELAIEYFDKAINLYKEIGDNYRLQFVLRDAINTLDSNEAEAIQKYYLLYYETNKKINSKELNRLLIETVDISGKLNKSIIEQMDSIRSRSRNAGIFLFTNVIILVVVIINVSKLIKEKDRNKKLLDEIAKRDYLTGTYTRLFGEAKINEMIGNNKKFSFAILDIDNFKYINDKYGHAFGDEVLVEVTKILNSRFTDEDLVIRFGGEEFIIIFNNRTKEDLKVELEEIKSRVNSLELENEVTITFSAGICEYKECSYYEEIFKKADGLLYEAKENGRDQIIL